MKKEFKIIAAGLGIILPASLANLGEVQACNVNDLSHNTILQNEVSKRIANFQVNCFTENNDNTMFAHANSHTDTGGHTDYHSNRNHSNQHANMNYANQCPSHSNSHTNVEGYDNHTDYGKQHTDRHVNRYDNC